VDKWVYAARFIGVGFFIAISIMLGLVFGFWLDSKFNVNFIWIIGLLAGIVVAFWGVYRMLMPLLSNNDSKNNGRNK
jgi:hypothetical protein